MARVEREPPPGVRDRSPESALLDEGINKPLEDPPLTAQSLCIEGQS